MALPIIAIYIFGFNMEGVGPAVSRFAVQGHDLIECKPFTPEADKFLDLLTHVSYFVQLPKLEPRYQNKVGHILSVFSQHWIHDQDSKRLILPDELKSDPILAPIVNRLHCAFADEKVRNTLVEEEAFDRTLLTNMGLAKAEGKIEGKIEMARNLLSLGVDEATILSASGLSLEEVKTLRSEQDQ